ncbi:MAG: alternative ribosome rescue aminoacyl-tRNA hydrolase ArfB [Anaerolineales bacterium]|nr:alternative ribosome rescue aminoacyl-tRNA hydrolase ArfB [Anaerolineales bacterium]
MISITPSIYLDEREITFAFIRASGPGGQNINKVATAAQLRFDVRNSPSLPEEVKARLLKLAGKRATEDGILVIEAKRYRTQEQNREDALQRFSALIQKALEKPKSRLATRPSAVARGQRLEAKKQRGAIKRMRREKEEINHDGIHH